MAPGGASVTMLQMRPRDEVAVTRVVPTVTHLARWSGAATSWFRKTCVVLPPSVPPCHVLLGGSPGPLPPDEIELPPTVSCQTSPAARLVPDQRTPWRTAARRVWPGGAGGLLHRCIIAP